METSTLSQPVSRRDVVRGAVGLGVLAPVAFGAPSAVRAEEDTHDYRGHPAVGIWVEENAGFPYAYQVNHSDGTLIYYNCYPNAFSSQSPSNLPVFGFGQWRPTGERTTEGVMQIAWGDTTVETLLTIWGRAELIDDNSARIEYREREVDRAGKVLSEYSGTGNVRRLQWEPFETTKTPVATPGA